jgi:hypothetical protein
MEKAAKGCRQAGRLFLVPAAYTKRQPNQKDTDSIPVDLKSQADGE